MVRKYVRKKYKFYVHIVWKGNPPVKVDTETGELKHMVGDVGIDIGISTVAISSKTEVKILEL